MPTPHTCALTEGHCQALLPSPPFPPPQCHWQPWHRPEDTNNSSRGSWEHGQPASTALKGNPEPAPPPTHTAPPAMGREGTAGTGGWGSTPWLRTPPHVPMQPLSPQGERWVLL